MSSTAGSSGMPERVLQPAALPRRPRRTGCRHRPAPRAPAAPRGHVLRATRARSGPARRRPRHEPATTGSSRRPSAPPAAGSARSPAWSVGQGTALPWNPIVHLLGVWLGVMLRTLSYTYSYSSSSPINPSWSASASPVRSASTTALVKTDGCSGARTSVSSVPSKAYSMAVDAVITARPRPPSRSPGGGRCRPAW